MTSKNIASIDLGSNSCRLRIEDKQGKIIYSDSKATKLAEGLFKNNCLTEEAMNRTFYALGEFSLFMELYEVVSYRAIATAACREAKNGKKFAAQVKTQTGINLEIISTQEEARLNLEGAVLNAPKNKEYVVVYDLGGASTEITFAKLTYPVKILHTVSIPWGARNATEAYDLQEFDCEKALKLRQDIKDYVSCFVKQSGLNEYKRDCCLIATSSTPLRLCSMVLGDECYSREKNDGTVIQITNLNQVISNICSMNLKQRSQSVYIGENRAPIFLTACLIFQTIYQELGFDELIVSYKSAQDAILKELRNEKIN